MKKILYLTLLISGLLPLSLKAGHSKALFTGKVKAFNGVDSLQVYYYPHETLNAGNMPSLMIHPDRNGYFEFEIPVGSEPVKMFLSILGKERNFINYYYVEEFDRIHFEIERTDKDIFLTFTGVGAEKYKQMDQFNLSTVKYQADFKVYRSELTRKLNGKNNPDSLNLVLLNYRRKVIDSILSQAHVLLETKKSDLSETVINLLIAEYLSCYQSHWMTLCNTTYRKSQTKQFQAKVMEYIKHHSVVVFLKDDFSGSISASYIRFLLEKNRFDAFQKGVVPISYTYLYNSIKNSYKNQLREKLLLNFFDDYKNEQFVSNYGHAEFDKAVQDAYELIRNPETKEAVKRKSRLSTGAPVYPFSFPDQDGKLHTLEELKGNVVLLDVWGEGCTACANFYRTFKNEVFEKLSKTSDFKLVSISIDRVKDTWIKGINSGKYTNNEHLNLYTAGKGIRHPWMEYYNILSIPFTLVIDRNGKVSSVLQSGMSGAAMIKILENAIQAPKPIFKD